MALLVGCGGGPTAPPSAPLPGGTADPEAETAAGGGEVTAPPSPEALHAAVPDPVRPDRGAAPGPDPVWPDRGPTPAPGPGSAPGADARGGDPGETRTANPPATVRIPRLGVAARVVPLDRDAEGRLTAPDRAELAGWDRHGAAPGAPGPTVIGAHVDLDGQAGAFAALGELHVGDELTVVDTVGAVTRYQVDGLGQYPKADLPTFEVHGHTEQDTLRLVTCAGPFQAATGGYRDNLVVFATAIAPPAQTDR
jgi:LPXTG-site transpeptidase (sortase) family protein